MFQGNNLVTQINKIQELGVLHMENNLDLSPVAEHGQDVMEADVLAVVESLQLVAHVLKEQIVLLRVNLQTAFEESQDEFYPKRK